MLLLVGSPLAVSSLGAVVLVFMAGQQREREIHLSELSGATPAQQGRQALFEAVIVVTTGAVLGLVMTLATMAVLQPALIAVSGAPAFRIDIAAFGFVTVILLVLNALATVVPTAVAQTRRDRVGIVG